MKAITLEISAFGPFADVTTIPFDKLGDTGLYLISGDTGAGKTTIFDAISYALFDSSSGGKREGNMFRSLYAHEDVPTYVEFTFEYKGSIYRINRNPVFERKKKRGDGFMVQTPDATIYFEDGSAINGVKNVNDFVENLLGINENQFKQIAMIAQGDFLKLLHANNNERQDLFRKIFSTDKFQLFEDKVRSENTRIKNDYDNVKRDFEYIADSIVLDNSDDFRANLLVNPQISKEVLEKSIDIQINEQKKNDDKKLENANNTKELTTLIASVETYHKNASEINTIEKRLVAHDSDLKSLLIKDETTPENKAKIEELTRDINRLRDSMPKYQTLDDTKAYLTTLTKNKETDSKKLINANAQLETMQKDLKDIEEYFEKNKNIQALSIKNEQELVENQKVLDTIAGLSISYKEIYSREDSMKVAYEFYQKLKQSLRELQETLDHRENIYLASQVGILASTLVPGKPCPVCGSLDHPNKAIISNEDATKEEIDALKSKVKAKEKEVSDKAVELERLKTERTSIILSVEKTLEQMSIVPDWIEAKKILLDYKSQLLDTKKTLEDRQKYFTEIMKNLEKNAERQKNLNVEIERYKKGISDLEKALISYDVSLTNESKNLETLSKELKFATKKEAEDEARKLFTGVTTIQAQIEELHKSIAEKKSSIVSDKNLIENISSKQDSKYDQNLETLNLSKNDLEVEIKELEKVSQDMATKISINQNQLRKLNQAIDKFAKLEADYRDINDIYRTVTGQISGKDNIKFEVFVQMSYFDDIISRANKRFLEMTNGQFSLRRRQDASNKSIQSGLEIELIDEYSAKARDIKTLSGGESFKAALSLALGLSDTVQMYSGGVELDSMFVDEGFGTLDKQSLNQVMSILNKLTSTKKLIGIISHVDSLKETIDRQIRVTKNSDMTSEIEIRA
ncbi:MAG: SMC family ATPase [Tissierellia bacterium]|nr:SMC family ATPase [Tissierellia bacterium]